MLTLLLIFKHFICTWFPVSYHNNIKINYVTPSTSIQLSIRKIMCLAVWTSPQDACSCRRNVLSGILKRPVDNTDMGHNNTSPGKYLTATWQSRLLNPLVHIHWLIIRSDNMCVLICFWADLLLRRNVRPHFICLCLHFTLLHFTT